VEVEVVVPDREHEGARGRPAKRISTFRTRRAATRRGDIPTARESGLVPPLRVMTLNVRRDVPHDGPLAWSSRRARVGAMLREAAPDVLATQEALPHQLADLDAALPRYRRIGSPRQ